MTKHRGEDVLQQGQDVFVGLKETSHLLQLHYSLVRALSNYRERNKESTGKEKARN